MRLLALAWLAGPGAMSAQAAFSTGFETSSGYTSGSTVIGVQDVNAPASTPWVNMFGSDATTMIASPANPAGGSLGFQLTDASTGTAYGASLNLASAVNTSAAFSLQFSLALSNLGGSGNAAQIYLGANSTTLGTLKYWMGLTVDQAGNMYLYEDTASGASGATAVGLGNYSLYAASGGYINFSIAIDPTTMKYTGVTLSGSLASADKTSAVLTAAGAGTVPYLHSTATLPSLYLDIVGGTSTTATIQVDNIQIVAVPEPPFLLLLGFGLAGFCGLGYLRATQVSDQAVA